MKTNLEIAGINIEITRKKVKNLNLRVYPSKGRVALSCPRQTSQFIIEDFIKEKKVWIRKQLKKGANRSEKKKLNYITGEYLPVWGKPRLLKVVNIGGKQRVELRDNDKVKLYVRGNSTSKKREKIVDEWYRVQLKLIIPQMISKWEPVMGVQVNEFGVKKMKTRWGTCNIRDKRIWLNLELAKLEPHCLEYIVVHEMVHLRERLHNKRFYTYMDQFLPEWKSTDKELKNYWI